MATEKVHSVIGGVTGVTALCRLGRTEWKMEGDDEIHGL